MLLKKSLLVIDILIVSVVMISCSMQKKPITDNGETTDIVVNTTIEQTETNTKSTQEYQRELLDKIETANDLSTILNNYNIKINKRNDYYDNNESVGTFIYLDREKYVSIMENGDRAGNMEIFVNGEHYLLLLGDLKKSNYIENSYDMDYIFCTQDLIFCKREDMKIIALEESAAEIILKTNISVDSFVKGKEGADNFVLQQERLNYNSININYIIDKETYLIKNKTMQRVDFSGTPVLYYEQYGYEYGDELYQLSETIQQDIKSGNYELVEY